MNSGQVARSTASSRSKEDRSKPGGLWFGDWICDLGLGVKLREVRPVVAPRKIVQNLGAKFGVQDLGFDGWNSDLDARSTSSSRPTGDCSKPAREIGGLGVVIRI